MIPKITHQTWKTRDIPARFQDASASWLALYPDWEYRLWTDDDLEKVVAKKFRAHFLCISPIPTRSSGWMRPVT